MKIAISNTAGRHLGTYDVEPSSSLSIEEQALEMMCAEAGYRNIKEAEAKRFVSRERILFTPES